MISKSRSEEIELLVESVAEFMDEVMTDKYRNYMCQPLFHSAQFLKSQLLQNMQNNSIRITWIAKQVMS